jgi:hypothetical protein
MGRIWIALLLIASLTANVWFVTRRGGETQPAATAVETPRPTAPGDSAAPALQPSGSYDLLDSVERDWLRRAGLENPAEDLREDLLQHPELIAAEGVAGGTMAFRRDAIWVLPGRHVWAMVDDGHIESMMLLTYNVDRERKITWSVVYHHAP